VRGAGDSPGALGESPGAPGDFSGAPGKSPGGVDSKHGFTTDGSPPATSHPKYVFQLSFSLMSRTLLSSFPEFFNFGSMFTILAQCLSAIYLLSAQTKLIYGSMNILHRHARCTSSHVQPVRWLQSKSKREADAIWGLGCPHQLVAVLRTFLDRTG
jgi:hypothetical protein